jgi:hypothetical protein
MESPRSRSMGRSPPAWRARRGRRVGRLRTTRRLTIRALAAGTLLATLAPVTAAAGDHVPFDPGFGQGPAAR